MTNNIFVIFGATGDLTSRKLLPSFAKLFSDLDYKGDSKVIALGRRDFSTADFFGYAGKSGLKFRDIEVLKDYTTYLKMDISNSENYFLLKNEIKKCQNKNVRVIFYLAVTPSLFLPISKALFNAGLLNKHDKNKVIAFEKPFGTSLTSAVEINEQLRKYVTEDQIFRIDHYLGKDMIQNILTMRFTNSLFTNSWNNKSIKSIKIFAKETQGILNRGAYYDSTGALKDMVQSHLLQVLTLLTMNEPKAFGSKEIVKEKVKVLRNLEIDETKSFLGQYEGYKNEHGISKASNTETFAFLTLFVNTPLFKGVPIQIITGKKLDKHHTYIEIEFIKSKAQQLNKIGGIGNKLIIEVSPESQVFLQVNSETSRHQLNMISNVGLQYCFSCNAPLEYGESYERLFLDLMSHSKTLFTSFIEVELAWQQIDKIKPLLNEVVTYKDYQQLETLMEELSK